MARTPTSSPKPSRRSCAAAAERPGHPDDVGRADALPRSGDARADGDGVDRRRVLCARRSPVRAAARPFAAPRRCARAASRDHAGVLAGRMLRPSRGRGRPCYAAVPDPQRGARVPHGSGSKSTACTSTLRRALRLGRAASERFSVSIIPTRGSGPCRRRPMSESALPDWVYRRWSDGRAQYVRGSRSAGWPQRPVRLRAIRRCRAPGA